MSLIPRPKSSLTRHEEGRVQKREAVHKRRSNDVNELLGRGINMYRKRERNHYKFVQFTVCLLVSAILAISCAKESGSTNTSPEDGDTQIDTKSAEMSSTTPAFPQITEAQLIPQSNDNSPSLFSQNASTALTLASSQDGQPVKLICVPNSLAYLGFVVDNYDLQGFPQDGILYINVPESDLIRQCESKINTKGVNLQVAKLGIRYHGRDFELKKTTTISNTIKVSIDFIDSLVTKSISQINLYCSLNNKKLSLGGNPVALSGKFYFDPSQLSNNNIIFINLARIAIQNQGYKFDDLSFDDCKQNLYATVNGSQYQKIYFVDDPIPLSNDDKFLIENAPPSSNNHDYSDLVCYFVDESGKLNWHWGFDYSNNIHKFHVKGQWSDGVFTTATKRSYLENVCSNFSTKYERKSWKLFNVEVADNFWSWSSPIQFTNESSNFHGLPFDKIVVFGDSIADNSASKKYSGFITERVLNEPKYPYFAGRYTGGLTENEDLAYLYNMPLFNWANAKDDSLEKQNILNSPISVAVNKYITESNIWGGGANKNKILYLIQVGGNFFTNTQDSPEDIFNNLSKDLKSAINKLVNEGAYYIALPYVYDPSHLFMSMKQIDPATYDKYTKLLTAVFDDIISSAQTDYGPKIQISGIQFQDLYDSISNEHASYGFQDISSPCYVAPVSEASGSIIFDNNSGDENVDTSTTKGVLCAKQSQYFYFDNIHSGATANLTLAWYSAQYLQQAFSNSTEKNPVVTFTANDYLNNVFSSNNPFLNFLLEKK